MRRNDDLRAGTKFLMKQFLLESSKQNRRSSQTIELLEKLRQENTSLKQSQNTQRMKYDRAIENLQQQLVSTQKKLDEKEQQLMQFRRLHSTRTPESLHRRNASKRDSGSEVPQSPRPPMQGFMIQKEAEERAKERVLESPQYRRPIMGRHENKENNGKRDYGHVDSYGNRLQTPPSRPFSGGTVGSGGIRNLTASSSFSFTGGVQKKRRSSSGRSASGMSPSHAFVNHQSGSYNVRSPSSAFQNRRYPRQYS